MALGRPRHHRGTTGSGDTAVLEQLPGTDDLTAELAAAAPRRYWNRWTVYLAGVLLLTGGFTAGVQVQQRWGSTASAGPGGGTGFPGGYGGAGGFPGRQQGTGAQPTAGAQHTGGSTTEGTVKLVNGTTVYVVTSDGRTVTVRTSDDTTVRTATESALSDLAEGDTVTVDGTVGDDSSVTATAITEK